MSDRLLRGRAARLLGVGLVVASLAIATACSGPAAPTVTSNNGTGSPTVVPGMADNLQPFYMQQLHWKGCKDKFQCTTLTVPIDYANPARGTLHLAMIRLPASDQKHRIGSLVINPGGPGGSGVDYAREATTVISNATRKRYDVVGFDPRGVGRSDPVECLTDKQTDQFLAADPTPTTPAEIADAVVQAKAFGADCVARTGPVLGFVGTRDAAHDLDVMRSALGDAKLYYLGKSYGTFLGATYADEFPTHVGRMVLDGVIDPALTSQEINLGQAEGFEVATHAFLTDCAKRASCPLGRDPAQAEVRLDAFLTGLDARPLPTKDRGRVLTEGLATLGVALPLYNKSYWPLLRTALSQALGGNGQGLLTLADNYSDRAANGTYDDNSNEAIYAVNCLDRSQPGGLAQIQQDATNFAAQAPTWGSLLAWSSLVCAYYPIPPTDQPKAVSAPGSGPILVVGTTRDPATPYQWAVNLSKELSDGHLLTYDGDGHTAYRMGSHCVDTVVDDYLLHDAVPPAGKRC